MSVEYSNCIKNYFSIKNQEISNAFVYLRIAAPFGNITSENFVSKLAIRKDSSHVLIKNNGQELFVTMAFFFVNENKTFALVKVHVLMTIDEYGRKMIDCCTKRCLVIPVSKISKCAVMSAVHYKKNESEVCEAIELEKPESDEDD